MPTETPTPWYQTPAARWVAGIVLGVLLSLLARLGITPAPLPPGLLERVERLEQQQAVIQATHK